MATSTELVVAGDKSSYLALQLEQDSLKDLIRTNIGNRQIDAFSLDRVKIPSGGSTTWIVETLDGEEAVKNIDGIIIHWATRRSYWREPKPDGSPPNCSSSDGLIGQGEPGGQCHDCVFNVFGTAIKDGGGPGRGKACKEFRQLFLLKPDSLLPIVINATPGSLKSVDTYFNRLLGAGVKSTALVTSLTLSKETSKDGQGFAMIQPKASTRLDPDAVARVEAIAGMYATVFESHRVVTDQGEDD